MDDELALEPLESSRNRRPRALWAALAAVAVVAAGLVVSSGGRAGDAPLLPVSLAAGGAGGRNEAASADMAMMAWVTYVPGEGLPALGGEAAAYRLSGSVTEADVRALATALGLVGAPTRNGASWQVVSDGARLEVYGSQWSYGSEYPEASGRGTSSSSGGSAGCEQVVEDGGVTSCELVTEVDCPPDAKCLEPLPIAPPPPPVDLPSEDEARRLALDLLAGTGMDVEGATVNIDGPFEAWYVSVEPKVDGLGTGLYAGVSVGSEGRILNASAVLGDLERVGDYPILDTSAAIERFNTQMTSYDIGMPGVPTPAIATDSASAAEPAVPDTTIVDPVGPDECAPQPDGSELCVHRDFVCAAPADDGVDDVACEDTPCPPVATTVPGTEPDEAVTEPSMPCDLAYPTPVDEEPYVEPEPVEVVLTGVEPVLVLLGAVDGTADTYLVPGYRFISDDGHQVDMPAVADEALAGFDPDTDTTVPDDTAVPPPPITGGGDDPCEALAEEDASGTTHTIACLPTTTTAHPGFGEIGVPYDVRVISHCGVIVDFDGRWWATEDVVTDLPADAGTLTLTEPDRGTFRGGDVEVTFVAQGPADEYPGCD